MSRFHWVPAVNASCFIYLTPNSFLKPVHNQLWLIVTLFTVMPSFLQGFILNSTALSPGHTSIQFNTINNTNIQIQWKSLLQTNQCKKKKTQFRVLNVLLLLKALSCHNKRTRICLRFSAAKLIFSILCSQLAHKEDKETAIHRMPFACWRWLLLQDGFKPWACQWESTLVRWLNNMKTKDKQPQWSWSRSTD